VTARLVIDISDCAEEGAMPVLRSTDVIHNIDSRRPGIPAASTRRRDPPRT
jgi:hypothetical protein